MSYNTTDCCLECIKEEIKEEPQDNEVIIVNNDPLFETQAALEAHLIYASTIDSETPVLDIEFIEIKEENVLDEPLKIPDAPANKVLSLADIPVICRICREAIPNTLRKLNEHYNTLHNGNKFKCTICCDKLFKDQRFWRSHEFEAENEIENLKFKKITLKKQELVTGRQCHETELKRKTPEKSAATINAADIEIEVKSKDKIIQNASEKLAVISELTPIITPNKSAAIIETINIADIEIQLKNTKENIQKQLKTYDSQRPKSELKRKTSENGDATIETINVADIEIHVKNREEIIQKHLKTYGHQWQKSELKRKTPEKGPATQTINIADIDTDIQNVPEERAVIQKNWNLTNEDPKDKANLPITCQICSILVPNVLSRIALHYNQEHGGYKFKCTVCCDTLFNSKIQWQTHEAIAKKDVKIFCKICEKSFSSHGWLNYHIQSDHVASKIQQIQCKNCPQLFKSAERMQKHWNSLHSEKALKKLETLKDKTFCRICSLDIHMKKAEHYKTVHNNYHYKCTVCCDKLFQTKWNLEIHLNKLCDKRPYSCEICSKSFRGSLTLKSHTRMSHPKGKYQDRPFKCDTCNKRYLVAGVLKAHKMSAHGPKIHKCPQCGALFGLESSLKNHIKVIHGERTVCHVCAKTCTSEANLKIHLKTHENQNKRLKKLEASSQIFTCAYCTKKFYQKHYLDNHIRIKHRHYEENEYLYTCDLCQTKFVHKDRLRLHMDFKHVTEKKYECEICKRKFRNYSTLFAHKKCKFVHAHILDENKLMDEKTC